MSAHTSSIVGIPRGSLPGFLTGLTAAALLLSPVPATAHQRSGDLLSTISAGSIGARAALPRAMFDARFEQHSRSGGGSSGGGGGHAVPRGGSGGGGSSSGGSSSGGGTRSSGGSSGGNPTTQSTGSAGSGGDQGGVQGAGHSRDGQPATGTAVRRPPGTGGPPIYGGGGYYPGYYPWGWGGLGVGAYFGYYEDWGWFDPYAPPVVYGYVVDGSVRLQVKPRNAEVYVDGYFAGEVDDYDGMFQRLRLEPGPHRIEIRLDGYEPLTFEVRILPDRTITYKGDLRKVGP